MCSSTKIAWCRFPVEQVKEWIVDDGNSPAKALKQMRTVCPAPVMHAHSPLCQDGLATR